MAEPEQQQQTDSPDKPRSQGVPNWMVIFIGLIFLVTCVYSIFSYGQWTSMDKALLETRRNRELEYRAYVVVKSAQLISEPANPAIGNVFVTAVNTGRTPGLNGKVLTEMKFQENPPPESTVLNPPDQTPSRTIFAPQIEIVKAAGSLPTDEARKIREAEAQALPTDDRPKRAAIPAPTVTPKSTPAPFVYQGNKKIYVYGILTYDDIFGNHRWTKFCFVNTPGTSLWWHCQTFNDSN